jgi:hypothetical protein
VFFCFLSPSTASLRTPPRAPRAPRAPFYAFSSPSAPPSNTRFASSFLPAALVHSL